MSGLEKFTQSSRQVLSLAHQEAEKFHHPQIRSEHILLGLIQENNGVAGRVLRELGIEIERAQEMVLRLTGMGTFTQGRIDLSIEAQKIIALSLEEAQKMSSRYISTEHLLLAIINSNDGLCESVLTKLGVTFEQVRRQITREINQKQSSLSKMSETPQEAPAPSKRAKKTPLVDQLAVDLTTQAEEHKLDPVIGREKEIERVIQILARRTKNNPALIGEPGVGKTAIVEGLAQRIVEGDVPIPLLGKRVLRLDVGSLVAGTMYRGQFEERLKRVIDELKKSDSILFIDEVHMLVGAGSAGSSVDAANILKPALSRGELQVVGATTLDEYRKNIESDAALERRFQPVVVNEPSKEETLEILRGIRKNYEDHHHLVISDEALEAAVNLSARYITDRFLPDKAIDLIDEASSRVRMYKSDAAKVTKQITDELRQLRTSHSDLMEKGEDEVALGVAGKIKDLEEKLNTIRDDWDRDTSPIVRPDDIAELVSMWTGVPIMQLAQEESIRLLNLEKEMHEMIVGQDEAIEKVAKAVRRGRAGLKDPKRPIGSFMFLGPTGVGKTELTKALARIMFGSEEALIQLDMSEYMEKHTVSRLMGSPPGYVGYEDAGQLTEAIRRRPYSIVVFDEVEKAHPEVHNTLLQILEEGQLTDAHGRKVNFQNAIIVMTSNIGAELIKRQSGLGFVLEQNENKEEEHIYKEIREKLLDSLKKAFRPEFLNRLDNVIVFHPLSKEHIHQITEMELVKVAKRLSEREIRLRASPAAVDKVAEKGYDPDMGARPIRRVIQLEIEDKLSDALLAETFRDGDDILIDVDQEGNFILLKDEERMASQGETLKMGA
ncbi:MAG: ATP-dependent Clp protease ATP-binding subunit [Anaerolineaceae bacterium]